MAMRGKAAPPCNLKGSDELHKRYKMHRYSRYLV